MNERLYRSRDDRLLAGVAGGVANRFQVDPSLVRIIWVLLILPTGFIALLLYVVMAFIVPEEPAGDARWAAWDGQQGGYAWPGEGTDMAGGAAMGAASPGTDAAGAGSAAATGAVAGGPGDTTGPAGAPAAGAPMAAGFAAATTGPTGAPAGPSGTTGMRPTGPGPGGPVGAPTPSWHDARRAARHERRGAGGALIFGVILVLVGTYFLVRTYVPEFDADRLWPVLLLIVGIALLAGSVRRASGPPSV